MAITGPGFALKPVIPVVVAGTMVSACAAIGPRNKSGDDEEARPWPRLLAPMRPRQAMTLKA